ncbi:hypothetical protein DSO57_1027114 [Entomophthora muscae]|uniref:Uncharacterized protein n=1 Tax=Entomophthora muscae TaxID=34485 RepID=A0ACC2UAX3_9FUNG|nr:hypothetical protein DSO57_1027114 [Entomophthora muscae]
MPLGWKSVATEHCALILTNPKLHFVAKEKLHGGWLIKAKINYDDRTSFSVYLVYAPAKRKPNRTFWQKLGTLEVEGLVIFLGDVNTVANPLYDIYGANKERRFGSKAYINTLNILQIQDALVRKCQCL